MPLQLDDLAALDAPTLENTGQPLMLPVESIDEDPEQPRREFEANRLEDLHGQIGEIFYWVIGFHVLAALYHHFVRKDDTLSRMR